MEIPVILSLRGTQAYADQEPEVIELVTEGTLKKTPAGWELSYEESDLTGLEGVTTTFVLEGEQVTLSRTGNLSSTMVFRPGFVHESLYQVEFGALLLRVCSSKVSYDVTQDGGTIDLVYNIEIEETSAGTIDYHLVIRAQ